MKSAWFAALGVVAVLAPFPAVGSDSLPVTGGVTFATDYLFRGISQTQHQPAVQAGLEYAHPLGFYVGTWASNVSWVEATNMKRNNSLEWDFYAGYRGALMGDLTWDVGVLIYSYPGSVLPGAVDTNSTEVYVGLGWKFVTVKYSHTVSSHLFGWVGPDGEKSRGSGYWDLSLNYPLDDGWAVQAHLGHQRIANRSSASYTDRKVGVSKELGFGTVAVAYSDTNAKGSCAKGEDYCWNGKDVGKGRAVVSWTKSF